MGYSVHLRMTDLEAIDDGILSIFFKYCHKWNGEGEDSVRLQWVVAGGL